MSLGTVPARSPLSTFLDLLLLLFSLLAGCFEKSEFAELLVASEQTRTMFLADSHPLPPSPCVPAKAALRLSVLDSTRSWLTTDEITAFLFHVRVRQDGPFAQLVPVDPWHSNKGVTKCRLGGEDDNWKASWEFATDESTGEVSGGQRRRRAGGEAAGPSSGVL